MLTTGNDQTFVTENVYIFERKRLTQPYIRIMKLSTDFEC